MGLDFKQVKYSPWGAYGNSKLANLLFAKALAKRLPETVTAVSLHPGVIRTPLWRETAAAGGLGGFLSEGLWRTKAFPRARRRRSGAPSRRSARTRRKTMRSRTRSGMRQSPA